MYKKPKKRLGQNFLIDKNVLQKICNACNIVSSDIVVEIGPGRGELTSLLVQIPKKIYAIEKDLDLIQGLKDRFAENNNLEIINQDILKVELKDIYQTHKKKIKLIGNIPYNISSPIIEYLINNRDFIDNAFFTVQKEFAQRLTASSGSKLYGSLSCFAQYYSNPKIIFGISRNCFRPVPKVDSSFIRIDIKNELPLDKTSEKKFFEITRASFNQRRKTLRNSLSKFISQDILDDFFKISGLDINTRPEKMLIKDFLTLTKLVISKRYQKK
ncbi:MAG: ribosomal RNA small subunit methyltransferase A [Candidatus Omnitrophica bacterium]|nr:ribosomal RNA small subunit methyltransferase A [Candidatus Omnitrophota bacterium]